MQDDDRRGTFTLIQQDYIDSIKEQLIEMTFDWCSGSDFETILKKTDSYEGSIIRTLRRLHELLKDMSTASKEIGNEVQSFLCRNLAISLSKPAIRSTEESSYPPLCMSSDFYVAFVYRNFYIFDVETKGQG